MFVCAVVVASPLQVRSAVEAAAEARASAGAATLAEQIASVVQKSSGDPATLKSRLSTLSLTDNSEGSMLQTKRFEPGALNDMAAAAPTAEAPSLASTVTGTVTGGASLSGTLSGTVPLGTTTGTTGTASAASKAPQPDSDFYVYSAKIPEVCYCFCFSCNALVCNCSFARHFWLRRVITRILAASASPAGSCSQRRRSRYRPQR